MPVTGWFADAAWVPAPDAPGRVARRVLVVTEGERIVEVSDERDPLADAYRLPGLLLPGLANAHSHAFHRALRARTEQGLGDFWTWREQMYRLVAGLHPEACYALARAAYAEMALAGVTAVGEFHYLHHRPTGRPYDPPTAMADALVAAAADAGLRLTLLDTCYLRGGFDQPLGEAQRRFSDGHAEAWAQRASLLRESATVRAGAAVHSVRAVDAAAMATVRAWAAARAAPLHVHVSEQPAENEACRQATGRTPTALLADHGLLGPRTTAVHATHVTDDDIARLGQSGTTVCLCPTTERSLADGVGPASALVAAGCRLAVGSDSHAVVDLFEEARAIELDERLASGRRGHHEPAALLRAATEAGMASLGWEAGRLAPGRLADFITVDLGSPRLAGWPRNDAAAAVVFAATAADVTHVVVGGRPVVVDRRHVGVGDVGAALDAAIRALAPDR